MMAVVMVIVVMSIVMMMVIMRTIYCPFINLLTQQQILQLKRQHK